MRGETIWLVGMMGAGKSAVGAALARRLGRAFVDSDARVEAEAGCSVAALFAAEGEAAFRARERRVVLALCREAAVVALGGGAVAQPGLAERIAEAGPVVWLRARPETLLARVGGGEARPLLRGLSAGARLARLGELLAAREGAYAAADVVVDTDGQSVDEVAARVAARLAGAS